MKKLITVLLATCIVCSLAGCVSTPDDSRSEQPPVVETTAEPTPERYPAVIPDQPVEWKDETFKHMVYDAEGWDYSKVVCPQDLMNIKSLFILADQRILINQPPMWDMDPEENGTDYIWQGVTYTQSVPMNLDDLVNFVNLEHLMVCLVEVNNIDFLPHIPVLKYLTMSGCGIDDISVLPQCSNLREISMPGNSISDISPVATMDLWDLFLPHNNISDISPLNLMRSLPSELVLSFNNISDISALKPHGRSDGLAYLNLRNNNISDISPLEDYVNISILSLSYNNISDFSPIEDLLKINNVYRIGNPGA